MTIDALAIPGIIAAAVVLFVLALLSSRRGKGRRGEAQVLAELEAERDVMRANHAVEIAALEGRLAEAMNRISANGDTLFRLKAAEGAAEAARREQAAHDLVRQQLTARIAALSAERDGLAERTAQVAKLVAERDLARAESAGLADDLVRARDELAAATAQLGGGRASDAQAPAEVQAAQAEAARQAERARELAREIEALKEQLGDPSPGAELAEVRDALDAARRTIADLSATADSGEPQRLLAMLAATEERERAANDSLSRLAYEEDGLRARLGALERSERAAKAEVEKREALLELRLSKIYDLEALLRDSAVEAIELRRRLAAAEAGEDVGGGAEKAAGDGSLLDELEALRQRAAEAGDGDTPGAAGELEQARAEIARLSAENRRLAEVPRLDEGAAERLRAELRTLAERFLAQAEASAPPAPDEPSLAERIRAFKAQRTGAPAA